MDKKRWIILNTVIVFSFIAVFLRLTDLMILNHKRLSNRAKQQHITTEEIKVRRGIIFDRQGRELALNLESESLYCEPQILSHNYKGITKLASVIAINPKVILTKLPADKKFAWVKRKLDPVIAGRIRNLNIKGLGFINEGKRVYPKGELASHILGFVGIDNQALEGIELQYDRYLTTQGGKIVFSRDAGGRMLSSGVDKEARGNNVVLTIDEGLQFIVEKEIGKAMSKWRAKAATAIMMDPYTGEILALANRPTYDPNYPGKAYAFQRRNRAITDCYEPGSTFKIINAVAALEEKIASPNTLFNVSKGYIEVGGNMIHDIHKHDILTLRGVIKKSSNVGSVIIGKKLGKEKVYKYVKKFGFGEKTGVDLLGEVSGWIRPPEKWSGTSIGAISIGQEIAATPLQVLRAYAVIANGGFLVRPHVVLEIISPEGQVLFSSRNNKKISIISPETARKFKNILKSVITEGGTGEEAYIEGNQIAGKTGTAQVIDTKTKRYSREKFVSSFVGFVPADNPRFALIVVVYEPKKQIYGAVVAAPVFREIAWQTLSYLNIPTEDNFYVRPLLVSK